MDLSKLSDADLAALQANDLSKLSDEGLNLIHSQKTRELRTPQGVPTEDDSSRETAGLRNPPSGELIKMLLGPPGPRPDGRKPFEPAANLSDASKALYNAGPAVAGMAMAAPVVAPAMGAGLAAAGSAAKAAAPSVLKHAAGYAVGEELIRKLLGR